MSHQRRLSEAARQHNIRDNRTHGGSVGHNNLGYDGNARQHNVRDNRTHGGSGGHNNLFQSLQQVHLPRIQQLVQLIVVLKCPCHRNII